MNKSYKELIVIRHGTSIWNVENRFTGWINISLDIKGREEAISTANLLLNNNISPEYIFSSKLIRAIETATLISNKMNIYNKVIHRRILALNERHYGVLQGMNRDEAKKKYGEELLHAYRRSFNVKPPQKDGMSESISDVYERIKTFFDNSLYKLYEKYNCIMIVSHGNTIRAIIKLLKNVMNDDLSAIKVPNASPLYIKLDNNMKYIEDRYINE